MLLSLNVIFTTCSFLCLSVGTRSDNGKILVRWMCLHAHFRDVLDVEYY